MLKTGDKVKIKVPLGERHGQSFYNGMTGVISSLYLVSRIVHVKIDRYFFDFCDKNGMSRIPTIDIEYIQNKIPIMPTE